MEFFLPSSQFVLSQTGSAESSIKNPNLVFICLAFVLLVRAGGEGRSECLLEISSCSFGSVLVICEWSVHGLDGAMASLSQGFSSWSSNKSKTATSWVTLTVEGSFSVVLSAENPCEWVLWASLCHDAELHVQFWAESGCFTLNHVAVSGWSALSPLSLVYFSIIEKCHFTDVQLLCYVFYLRDPVLVSLPVSSNRNGAIYEQKRLSIWEKVPCLNESHSFPIMVTCI